MIKLTKNKFNKFPKSNKSMIYLMWIYTFGQFISSIFISIYIFKLNNDINNVIIYNIIFFSTVLLGFSGIGYIISRLKKNIKVMYYLSYIILILSFVILFIFKNSIIATYVFGAIYGLGFGAFWCAVHANELQNIRDKDRDFYSSLISAGGNILQVITPLLVSFVFIFSESINYNGYYILFIIIPIVYLSSFLFIKNTGKYIPTIINKKDIKIFFNCSRYFWGHSYIYLTGATHALKVASVPIIAILLLKNEINIGFFESIMGIISFMVVLSLSHIRNQGNRLKMLFLLAILIFISHLLLIFMFNVYGYIIFSLLLIILNPLYRVSEHVYDLKIMDTIKNKGSDFFPSMLLREIIIGFSRVSILIICLVIINIFPNDLELILKIILSISGIMYLLTWLSIKMHITYENHDNIGDLN